MRRGRGLLYMCNASIIAHAGADLPQQHHLATCFPTNSNAQLILNLAFKPHSSPQISSNEHTPTPSNLKDAHTTPTSIVYASLLVVSLD